MKKQTLIAAILFVAAVILQPDYTLKAQAQDSTEKASLQLIEIEHSPWEDTTVTLSNPKEQTTTELTTKITSYRLREDISYPVTAFKSPSNESFWIGLEQDFYVELETGITGGKFQPSGVIVWCQSLAPKSTPAPATLNSVITAFEEKTDCKKLDDSMFGGSIGNLELQRENTTLLKKVFGIETAAFSDSPRSSTLSPCSEDFNN